MKNFVFNVLKNTKHIAFKTNDLRFYNILLNDGVS